MTRALTILNELGDVTLIWDPAQDDKMEAMIAKKIRQVPLSRRFGSEDCGASTAWLVMILALWMAKAIIASYSNSGCLATEPQSGPLRLMLSRNRSPSLTPCCRR